MYYIVKTAKYGGGIVSKHRNEEQAEHALQRLPKGACGIVAGCQIKELPFPWQCRDKSQLAK